MSVENVLKMIQENDIKFVDFRFCDTRGKEQHVTFPAHTIDEDTFEEGNMFDGSSIAGWKHINESDMILMPDASTAVIDPFFDDTTLIIRCDIIEPKNMQGYERDPRSLAKRAEAYLKSTGIADTAFFGPENEFFIFDDIRWGTDMSGSFYKVDSQEAGWNSEKVYEDGNIGHRPGVKGGYFPVPPVDSFQDMRSAMCLTLEQMGQITEVHHHEVATAGQCEIGVRFNTLVKKADEVLGLKYVVANIAHAYGKTATFMPKPLVGDNGSGMHVHQSLAKDGVNLFSGDLYGGLSETALVRMTQASPRCSILRRSPATPTVMAPTTAAINSKLSVPTPSLLSSPPASTCSSPRVGRSTSSARTMTRLLVQSTERPTSSFLAVRPATPAGFSRLTLRSPTVRRQRGSINV